jgi:hypothetical protein
MAAPGHLKRAAATLRGGAFAVITQRDVSALRSDNADALRAEEIEQEEEAEIEEAHASNRQPSGREHILIHLSAAFRAALASNDLEAADVVIDAIAPWRTQGGVVFT